MTIQQCKYVLTIADIGSFSKASKILYISQSGLSESVKALEDELGITIFERSSTGAFLTKDGMEFLSYASSIVAKDRFVRERYDCAHTYQRLYVATQHYDFVADVFTKMLVECSNKCYKMSLREMRTHDVIEDITCGRSDIGVLAIKSGDAVIMNRYLANKSLTFSAFLTASPHIYLRRNHPLTQQSPLTLPALEAFPYVSYEQGQHNISVFAEEFPLPFHPQKQIEISDRATLMNVLLSTDSYTVGTGVMPSSLNNGKIVSIPLESADFYTIGYLWRKDRALSEMARNFMNRMDQITNNF